MKKIFKMALVGILAVTCIACGGSKKEKAICSIELKESGIVHEMVLEAEGDIVHTMTQITNANLAYYSVQQIADLEKNMESYREMYELIDGVDYEVEKNANTFCEKIVIDMANERTIEVLQYNELLPVGISSKMSLDETVKSLESQGWTVEVTEE